MRRSEFDEPSHVSTWLLAGGALVSVGAVAAALVSQHVFAMEPCPYCVLQRVIFLAVAIACLIALMLPNPGGRRTATGLGLLLAISGIVTAVYQHFVAAATASCNLTLADKIVGGMHLDSLLPDVFSARASCADAAVNLLGVPYDFWSLALFSALAVGLVRVMRRPMD